MATVASNIVTPQQAALSAKKNPPLLPGLGGDSTPAKPINFAGGLKMGTTSLSTKSAPPPAPVIKKTTVTEYHKPEVAATDPAIAANGTQNNMQKPLIPLQPFQQTTEKIDNTATSGNDEIKAKAEEIRTRYGKELADLGIFDRAAAGDATTGTAPVGGGNANIEFNTKSGRATALTSAETAELGALGAQQTANTQKQSGLISLGGLQAPTLSSQGNTFYDPVSGKVTDAGNQAALNPIANIQSIAQQVANGQISPSQADALGGNVANFAGALNQAIIGINPKYDRARAQAAFDAKQSNSTNSGTAANQAAFTGYQGAIQERTNADASYTKLTGISGQLTEALSKWGQSGALTDYNAAVNTLASHLPTPEYQAFITALGNTQAAYQGILGSSGVTPTKADQDALNALNVNQSASTIIAALNQLSKDAHALIVEPSYQKVSQYESTLGIK